MRDLREKQQETSFLAASQRGQRRRGRLGNGSLAGSRHPTDVGLQSPIHAFTLQATAVHLPSRAQTQVGGWTRSDAGWFPVLEAQSGGGKRQGVSHCKSSDQGGLMAVEIYGVLCRGQALSWAVCLGLTLAETLSTSLRIPI